MVEWVGTENLKEVEIFLGHSEESAQILINNLRLHGFAVGEDINSGNFKAIRQKGAIVAVFCLARRGNLVIQSSVSLPDLVLKACATENISIRGFLGEWSSAEPVYRRYKELNPEYSPHYFSKDILYSIDLSPSAPEIRHDQRVRLLAENDFQQWLDVNSAYMSELALPEDQTFEEKQRSFARQIASKQIWGFFENERLLSRAALNSNGLRLGQVGGVFTVPEFRQRGLAKATMFHMLKDCRDLHGHIKSVLFTGETDLAAQKLYESMGYRKIGDFALILGK